MSPIGMLRISLTVGLLLAIGCFSPALAAPAGISTESTIVFCSDTGSRNCRSAFRGSKRNWLLAATEGGKHSGGFVFDTSSIRHSTKPALLIRLGEKIARQALKRRFAGYDVRYTTGEGCLTCAVITGADGQFEVDFDHDGRTVINLRSTDDRARDAKGSEVGSSLTVAIDSNIGNCDAGESTTCSSASQPTLSYIVAEDNRCRLDVQEKQPTTIPACARIGGFQIFSAEPASLTQDDYTLICQGELLLSSRGEESVSKLRTPVSFRIHFTGNETSWTDPHDKSETTFENLTLSMGNRSIQGGQIKGSTFSSSTTFDDPFSSTGRGTINWGYAKRLNAFTLIINSETYLCKSGLDTPK